MDDVRQDTAIAPSNVNGSNGSKVVNGAAEENGGAAVNGKKSEGTNGATNGNNNNNARPSLAVPQSVVDEALKVTRECLDAVCEIDENGAT
jgi:hypothetical protein